MTKTQTRSKKSAKPVEPPKTHRGIKVAAIVAAILILLLGGVGTWFFAYYSSPEKVALDAVENLFLAKNVSLEGGVNLFLSDELKEDSPFAGLIFSFDSSSHSLPLSNSAKAQILYNDGVISDDAKFVVTLRNVIMRDGVFYFQIGGIVDSLHSLGYDFEESPEVADYLPLIETIDNEWWQVDVNDILADLDLPVSQQDSMSQLYSCVVETLNRDSSSEMTKLYQEHRFINVSPTQHLAPEGDAYPDLASWHKAYEITLNRQELANYINAIPETETANQFYACFNAVEDEYADVPLSLGAADFDEISASDIEWPDGLRVFVEVSTFGHRLRSIYVYQNTDDYQLGGSIMVNYQNVTVSAPDSYRPISDLYEEFLELILQNIPGVEEI